MKLVIDTNRIIDALVKDGFSRQIISYFPIEFISPEFTRKEVDKYEKEIIEKAGISKNEFEALLASILERITIFSQDTYSLYMEQADKIMGNIDIKDVMFLALALAVPNDGIWSEDAHFERQNKVRLWKTSELIGFLKKEE